MPYIKQEERKEVDLATERLISDLQYSSTPLSGKVVYVFCKILIALYNRDGFEWRANPLKVLESVKLEYYRRVLVPYEDEKIKENGDIL